MSKTPPGMMGGADLATGGRRGESKHKDVRHLDFHEEDPLGEAQLAAWVKQASQLPGELLWQEVASSVRGVSGRQVISPQARGAETAGELCSASWTGRSRRCGDPPVETALSYIVSAGEGLAVDY